LPSSQQPGTGPYPEPDESGPQPMIPSRPILSLSFHLISWLPSIFFLTVFHPEHFKHFFCLPYLTNSISILRHPQFDHTNISLDVQITKPHIMQISPVSSYFLCLTSKHFLDSMFRTPLVYFLPLMWQTNFQNLKNKRKNYSFCSLVFKFFDNKESERSWNKWQKLLSKLKLLKCIPKWVLIS